MKHFTPIYFLLILTILVACAGTKESRRIKRGSGVIQDSKILLKANSEGAVSFYSFTIRENNFFSINESVMFWWEYYAGTYNIKSDTIHLSYIDGHKRTDLANFVYFKGDTLYMPMINSSKILPLKIECNKLMMK